MKTAVNDNYVTRSDDDRVNWPVRLIFVLAATAAFFVLHFVDPVMAGSWAPVRTSCGVITGLPCIFCGMTRALHLLLNGDFGGALYFNWLAFPFLGVGARFIARFAPGGVHATSRSELTNVRTGNVPPSHGITARFVC